MIKIPPNNQWESSGSSDSTGSLWSSFNLDLTTKPGKTLVSPRTIITTNDITDLGVPVAFNTFTDVNAGIQYSWCVAGLYLFRMSLTNGYQTAFTKVTTSGTPTAGTNTECSSDLSDMVNYGKVYLIVSTNTRMDFFTASSGVWVNVSYDTGGVPTPVTLTNGAPHMLEVYAGRLYVTDNSTQVRSVAGTNLLSASATNTLTTTGSNFLDLTNKGYPVTSISFIKAVSNGIWVGTINQSENGCYIFKWDGATASDPNSAYIIPDASGLLACVIINDTPWVIDNSGRLLTFNGGSFVEVPKGKLPINEKKFLKNSLSAVNDRWIHPNGIEVIDGKINILINNEYEDSGTTIEENIPSGLWEFDPSIGWYHKMSLSLYTSTVTDFGQNRVSRVGAIYGNKTSTTNASANGTILLGAQVYTDSSTTAENIYINDSGDTLQKYGYLVTPKIYSPNIMDSFQKIVPRFKKFLNSNDSIAVKYRDDDPVATEITITWTAATTFTYAGDLTAFAGYEVEGIQGKGSGKCAHISSVAYSVGTSTVTLDDSFTGATSGTAKVRIQNWKKAGIYNARTDKFYLFSVTENSISTWIQFKLGMLFTGANELDDIILINTPHQLAK